MSGSCLGSGWLLIQPSPHSFTVSDNQVVPCSPGTCHFVWGSPNICVVIYSWGFPSLFFGFRCECLSGLCGFPVCEVGSTPRIVSRGDGTPGKCCDVFECVNGTWGFSCSQRVFICAAGGGGRASQPSSFCQLEQGAYLGTCWGWLRVGTCLVTVQLRKLGR